MTETPASSRVTQHSGNRRSNGAGGIAARGSGSDRNAPGRNGTPRYTEADLEPIRARLAAFARGDFRPRGGPDDRHPAAAGPVLAEISQLADEVGAQLAAVTSEVAQRAAQVREALKSLERNENVWLVLMDVMMPELDGNASVGHRRVRHRRVRHCRAGHQGAGY